MCPRADAVIMTFASSKPPNDAGFARIFLIAIGLTFCSFVILSLEYGVFNFGDSDLPPSQPDTPFEISCDTVWFAATAGAALYWLYATALAFRAVFRLVTGMVRKNI